MSIYLQAMQLKLSGELTKGNYYTPIKEAIASKGRQLTDEELVNIYNQNK